MLSKEGQEVVVKDGYMPLLGEAGRQKSCAKIKSGSRLSRVASDR